MEEKNEEEKGNEVKDEEESRGRDKNGGQKEVKLEER